MTTMSKTCLNCAVVMGCPKLGDHRGIFLPELVITEDNLRECTEWTPVGGHQKWVRDVLYGLQGDGGVRVLHQMPQMIMEDLVKQEQEEQEMNRDDSPDFVAMLREGMTTSEREEQLRYETDAQGTVLVDDQGNKRPRAQYIIGRFATDPSLHIQLDHSAGMFYKLDEVIKFILDKEVEAGLIVKSKRPKKETQATDAQAPEVQTQKETIMPIEGRKIIRPTAKGAAAAPAAAEAAPAPAQAAAPKGPVGLPKVPGKIAQPPKRAAAAAPVEEAAPAAEAPVGIDLKELIPEIQVAVGQTVQAAVEVAVNAAKDEILAKVQESLDRIIEAITIMHDLHVQTGGTFRDGEGAPLEEKFDKDTKIFDHLAG